MSIIKSIWLVMDFWSMAVIAIFALMCLVIYRLDKTADNVFKFHDLFTSGDWPGKASGARLCYFGAWLTHSLALLYTVFKNASGLDNATGTSYALIWSGAYIALKALDRIPQGGVNGQGTNPAGNPGTSPGGTQVSGAAMGGREGGPAIQSP